MSLKRFIAYYPDRVPWLGRCTVTKIDYIKKTADIANASISTVAELKDLVVCEEVPAKDINGLDLYLGDIVSNSHDISFVVAHKGGKYILNRVPDGGEIDIPLTYVKYFALSGSVHDIKERHWLSKLVKERDELHIYIKNNDSKVGEQRNDKLEQFVVKTRRVLTTFFQDIFDRVQSAEISKHQIPDITEKICGILKEIGYDYQVCWSKYLDKMFWRVTMVCGDSHLVITEEHKII